MPRLPNRPAPGRYVRVLNRPRIDVIGKVLRHEHDGMTVRVPNWCADGWHMDFFVRWDEWERSSKKACKDAADKRWL